MSRQRRLMMIGLVGAAALVFVGCTFSSIGIQTAQIGELTRTHTTIELGDADQVRVTIKMGAGELKVDNGADDLMEAEFTYNVPEWEPAVSYDVDEGDGRLIVRQPNTDEFPFNSDIRYEWDLSFADDVPLDMRIECGAGTQDIDLAGLWITDLDIKLGAGSTDITLSNNSALQRADIDIGAGDTTIDLNGPWSEDAEVDIQGGVGQISVGLPRDVGVRVVVTKGLGDVDASGLYRDGTAWVNEAYGESDVTLEVSIQAGIGQVNLDVRE
ncbi:MAG: toast rack family protein [Anaerolineae bacterium]|nr:toast rack family protein [Anaerolineae bacterium]